MGIHILSPTCRKLSRERPSAHRILASIPPSFSFTHYIIILFTITAKDKSCTTNTSVDRMLLPFAVIPTVGIHAVQCILDPWLAATAEHVFDSTVLDRQRLRLLLLVVEVPVFGHRPEKQKKAILQEDC